MPGKRSVIKNYTDEHSKSGLAASLPDIQTWLNQYHNYQITIKIPEYTSICPKTALPDFGTLTINYVPKKKCLELKSLKEYIFSYRNLGIFYENAVNRVLNDIVFACNPKWATVRGDFSSRGGIKTAIEAQFPKLKRQNNL